jgi:hypothetical protein
VKRRGARPHGGPEGVAEVKRQPICRFSFEVATTCPDILVIVEPSAGGSGSRLLKTVAPTYPVRNASITLLTDFMLPKRSPCQLT